MDIGTVPIYTSRLKLRKITLEDVQAIFTHLKSDERITDNMIKGAHKSPEETVVIVEEIIREYETPAFYYWGIELLETNELIGMIDLYDYEPDEAKCKTGYSIGYRWWNKGYGTEALKAVIDFAFERLNVCEISAAHNTDNPASGRIMEKAGMKQDHIVKAMITNAKGQIKDCAVCIIRKPQ